MDDVLLACPIDDDRGRLSSVCCIVSVPRDTVVPGCSACLPPNRLTYAEPVTMDKGLGLALALS